MDIEQIRSLIELMVDNDLDRIEINEGETRILLRRGGMYAPPAAAPMIAQAFAPAAAPVAAAAPQAAVPVAESSSADEITIRSPMVGTYYAAADPESPPFVKVGDVIHKDSVVCLIEAMKVFNEIKAELEGRITRVLVSNGQAVEYDQPLFAIASA